MQRVILLVDMNAFFISCEMSRKPELKGKPAAVAGDPKNRSGIILAANYEARKYKVKTTMIIHEAKKLCPGLVCVPPDHGFYEEKSKQVMEILNRYSPLVQQNSIDEAWVDITGCETLFGSPLKIAEGIMKDIREELDLWCSIGIADNKFLAKMASEMKKPLGITELFQKDVKVKLWPLKVGDMYGIGKQTEKKLVNSAIFTIGDLARSKKELLVKTFGKYGAEMHSLANGIDTGMVEISPKYDSKSIGRSTTLPVDITDIETAKTILMKLAEEVGMESREYGFKGKTVSITIKYNDFQVITRQKSIHPTFLTKDIYKTGVDLLEENWNSIRPIRLIGIALSNFKSEDVKQISIFDNACTIETKSDKEEKIEKALDDIRRKYGMDKIKRAKTIEK